MAFSMFRSCFLICNPKKEKILTHTARHKQLHDQLTSCYKIHGLVSSRGRFGDDMKLHRMRLVVPKPRYIAYKLNPFDSLFGLNWHKKQIYKTKQLLQF